MIRWVQHVAGLDSGSGTWYLWWSGIGADLGELAIVIVVWHHLNCHTAGCWKPARHHTGGYCRKHSGTA